MVHRPNPVLSFTNDQPWGALVHQDSGKCVLMVGERDGICLLDWGQDGRALGTMHEIRLAGDEVREQVYYLALADNLQKAEGYKMLSHYRS